MAAMYGTLAAATIAAVVAQAPIPNPAQAQLLTSYVNSTGARCLDGTPALYWIQTTNSNKWVFDIMGGGWCESDAACAQRAYGSSCMLGSSNPACFSSQLEPGNSLPGQNYSSNWDFSDIPSCLGSRWCGGLMNNDPSHNPLTAEWNKVMFHYCDGGSHGGDNETVTYVDFNGATLPLYYRGRRNLDAYLSDMIARFKLGQATHVIVTGNSAGGLATYWALDHISSRLPGAFVVGAPDSGYFFYDASYPAWGTNLRWVASAMNATYNLNSNCVAAKVGAGEDPNDCAFPEVATAYIQTPMFVMNSKIDPALDSISGGESGKNASNVNRLGARLLELVSSTVLQNPQNAAYLTSCHEHCGQWAQDQQLGQNGEFNDFNVTIDGTTAIPAFTQWYVPLAAGVQSAAAKVWIQPALYPCATCCQGGQA